MEAAPNGDARDLFWEPVFSPGGLGLARVHGTRNERVMETNENTTKFGKSSFSRCRILSVDRTYLGI